MDVDFTPWIQVLQVGGVALVVLFFVGIALWRGMAWLANRLDTWIAPLVKQHMDLVAELRDAVHDFRAKLQDIKDELKTLGRSG